MTNSPHSGSEVSKAFDRLHPEVQRWIWQQNWETLRAVQEQAIHTILDHSSDVIIAASTAAGKTEAAFLPILSCVADQPQGGLSVLYVGPLKALINDQFRRLEDLCQLLDLPVVRWHGDAPQSAKARLLKNPHGIALITPESIEALLVRRPDAAIKLFGGLQFIVIDELHAFLKGPRGLHLSSLLRRIERLARHRPRRIGLSATLGDFTQAKRWIHPEEPEHVRMVDPIGAAPELQLQIRAYVDHPDVKDPYGIEDEAAPWHPSAFDRIADHLFTRLRSSNNLVFAGSRKRVETLSDRLRRRSETANVPNEFYPHHGNLSKELREELESRLKVGTLPTTGIATTTLELGIDIGSVKSVAQIGPPQSLASLRQRLGRSGRRQGEPTILRIYLREPYLASDAGLPAVLRFSVVQSVAAVKLLIQKFVEPATGDTTIATVLLHQILSLICERGAQRAERLFEQLVHGPLNSISKPQFADLLRSMAAAALIEQSPDGSIMLGATGERITGRYDFYAIFETDDEWRLVASGRTLGTVPVSNAVAIGSIIIFGGQRWRVASLDEPSKVLDVVAHRSGTPPEFESAGGDGLHKRFVEEIRSVFESDDLPSYLDATARELLLEGRRAYLALELKTRSIIEFGPDTFLFLWEGSEVCEVIQIALMTAGLSVERAVDGVICVLATDERTVRAILTQMQNNPPDVDTLSDFVENLRTAKFDEFVSDKLLKALWANRHRNAVTELAEICARIMLS
jgi:ATP-dependent Lhr-like helicase